MKISSLKKTLIKITILLASSNSALAWSGYDYDNKTAIDIGEGNLVREGLVIQFYEQKDDNFHTAKVLFIDPVAGGIRIQVEDLDQNNEERTFIMED